MKKLLGMCVFLFLASHCQARVWEYSYEEGNEVAIDNGNEIDVVISSVTFTFLNKNNPVKYTFNLENSRLPANSGKIHIGQLFINSFVPVGKIKATMSVSFTNGITITREFVAQFK